MLYFVFLAKTRFFQHINIMLSHGLVNAIAVTDPIDGVNNAIDVQVAKNQSDLEQEIVILSQLHIINLQ